MNTRIRSLVSTCASTLFLGLVLSTSTGCGMVAAVANPKVAWAINDPAPMSVVVRRADAAQATTVEVDRLLTSTPTSLDSAWIAGIGPDPKDAAAELRTLGQDPVYAQSHARVVAAEVWVTTLSALKSTKGDHPNLLSAIDADLGDTYSKIMSKKVEVAGLVALAEQEKATLGARDISAEDKAEHATTLAKLQKMQSDSEADVAPLETAFLASAKDTAKKASPEVQQKLAPAIANLLRALADADVANSAAAVRYPLAIPSLPSSVKAIVPAIVADIVQEKTGHRPSVAKLDAQVALHGTDVDITLAGLGPSDLGSLKLDNLTKETIVRTGKWVVHAAGLLGAVSSTKQSLAFETNVLTQILDGFAPAGGIDALAVKIPTLDGSGVASGGSMPKLPSFSATAALDKKLPGVAATAALDKKLPGVPSGGATAMLDKKVALPHAPTGALAAAGLDKKVPGLAGGAGALEKGVPGVAAANAALDKKIPGAGAAASLLEKKIPGGGAIGSAASLTSAVIANPKEAAANIAKTEANNALKKVPGGSMLGGLAGFGK